MTKNLGDVAQSLLAHYESSVSAGRMLRDQAQKAALEAVSALRFGNADFFFVLDTEGLLIANAFNKLSAAQDLARYASGLGQEVTRFLAAVKAA